MSRFAILGSRGYPSSYGGFETLVRHLAPYLVERGHEVVVYGRADGTRSFTRTIDGVQVHCTRGLPFKSTSTLSFGLTASAHLARHPTDAALILNIANGFYLKELGRARVGTCVNVDGLEWDRGKWGRAARKTFLHGALATARHADALVVDSEALGKIWQERFGRRSHFIPYGAPLLDDVGSIRLRDHGLPTSGYVLVVARIVPENNVDLLLDALPYFPAGTQTVVVGDANYRHATIERLTALAAQKQIHWLGHVHDQELLNELWANAGVYWHGHSVGGTNPALLQALGAGAPTVALDTSFNREVIGRDEQLVPDDPGAVGSRIAAVLRLPSLASALSEWGREIVRERYAWDDVCRRYEQLLEEVGARRVARPRHRTSPNGRPATAQTEADTNTRHAIRGSIVAVVGPDGAGKSQLTSDLLPALAARTSRPVRVVNFRGRHVDRLLGRRRDEVALKQASATPSETPSLRPASASLKLAVLWADLLWSAWIWRRRVPQEITLVERYAYDFVIDPVRLGLAHAPPRLRQLALRTTAAPDVVLVCRAPASAVHARKAEQDETEVSRQYRVWDELRASVGAPVIDVDTTTYVDAVELSGRILSAIHK